MIPAVSLTIYDHGHAHCPIAREIAERHGGGIKDEKKHGVIRLIGDTGDQIFCISHDLRFHWNWLFLTVIVVSQLRVTSSRLPSAFQCEEGVYDIRVHLHRKIWLTDCVTATTRCATTFVLT